MSIKIHGFNMDPIFSEMKNVSGDDMNTQGGMTQADNDFKKYLYNLAYNLPNDYEQFSGNRFADISPEEQSIIRQLQGGGGYAPMYDTARTNLGLAGDVYKSQMGVSNKDLVSQADDFQNPYLADVEQQIGGQLSQALANANISNNASAFGSGAGGGSRVGYAMQPTQEALFRGAGDAIANTRFASYTDSLNRARQANVDRARSADSYANYVNQDLGLGVGALDKDYLTKLGAFRQDRANQQQDLDFKYEESVRDRMFPFQRLATLGNLFGNVPIEEKVVEQKPAEGGKSGLF